MKQRVEEMEREAKKLRELQAAAEEAATESSAGVERPEGEEAVPMDAEDDPDKAMIDGRSVFVGNVSNTCFCSGPVLSLLLV
jgi:hypothetical protein